MEEEEEMKKLPKIQIDGLIDLAVSLKDGEVFRQRNIPIPVLVNLKAIFFLIFLKNSLIFHTKGLLVLCVQQNL